MSLLRTFFVAPLLIRAATALSSLGADGDSCSHCYAMANELLGSHCPEHDAGCMVEAFVAEQKAILEKPGGIATVKRVYACVKESNCDFQALRKSASAAGLDVPTPADEERIIHEAHLSQDDVNTVKNDLREIVAGTSLLQSTPSEACAHCYVKANELLKSHCPDHGAPQVRATCMLKAIRAQEDALATSTDPAVKAALPSDYVCFKEHHCDLKELEAAAKQEGVTVAEVKRVAKEGRLSDKDAATMKADLKTVDPKLVISAALVDRTKKTDACQRCYDKANYLMGPMGCDPCHDSSCVVDCFAKHKAEIMQKKDSVARMTEIYTCAQAERCDIAAAKKEASKDGLDVPDSDDGAAASQLQTSYVIESHGRTGLFRPRDQASPEDAFQR